MYAPFPYIGRLYCLLIIGSLTLQSQDRQVTPPASPLAPAVQEYPPELLLSAGIGWGLQQGSFHSRCSQEFTYGRSTGWLVGISYSSPLLQNWLWGASTWINRLQLRASYRAREPFSIQAPSDTFLLPVETRNHAEITLTSLLLWGYLRWRPAPWLVASAGPAAIIPLSVTLRHDKALLSESLSLPTGESIYLPATENFTVEEASIPSRLHWGGLFHIGADVVITPNWWLSAGLYGLLHFSAVLPPPSTVRLWQGYLVFSLGKTWRK